MTDRIDYAAHANRNLGSVVGQNPDVALVYAVAAQAQATLALVEQQRLANLIALAESCHPLLREQVADDAAATLTVAREHDEEGMGGWHELSADVAAALGIEVRNG